MSVRILALVLCATSPLAWLPAGGAEPAPAGPEFQVNAYTTEDQSNPAVAADADGRFVVVWDSYGGVGSDDDYGSIQGQRYAADGTPLGPQFQVNTYTTDSQFYPAVAADRAGNFVVVWNGYASAGSDTSGRSIQAQRYDADGMPLGAEFQVNTYTSGGQFDPMVAADGGGSFVVVWSSDGSPGSDGNYESIQGRRYDAGGTPQGDQFQVNSYTTSHQFAPVVAVDGSGRFVVVWTSSGSAGSDGEYESVQGQRYDAGGTPQGAEFQVNTYTTDSQVDAAVAADGSGNFVVVWSSYGSLGTDDDYDSIQGRRYDADGTPQGPEFQVNAHTTGYQYLPAVAADGSGRFVVVWESSTSGDLDSGDLDILGRRLDASGEPEGAEFEANTYTTGGPRSPAVAADGRDGGGDFVVVWSSYAPEDQDGDLGGVFGRRFVEAENTTSSSTTTTSSTSTSTDGPTSSSSTTSVTSISSTTSSSTTTTIVVVPCSRPEDEHAGCDDGDPCTAGDVCGGGVCGGQHFCTLGLPPPDEPIPADDGVRVEVSADPGATVEARLFEAPTSTLATPAGTSQAELVGAPLSKLKSKRVKRKGHVVLRLRLNARGRALLKRASDGILPVVVRTTVRASEREASLSRLLKLLRVQR